MVSAILACVPPAVGSCILVVGTTASVGLNAQKRRKGRIDRLVHQMNEQENDATDPKPRDEEYGSGVLGEQDSRIVLGNKSEKTALTNHKTSNASLSPEAEPGRVDADKHEGINTNELIVPKVPLRLPTVSAATNIFGSSTYIIFVCTACIHGICLVLTGLLQHEQALNSSRVTDSAFASTMGLLVLLGAIVASISIILTSLAPAKGRWTKPHITFGAIFFQSSICWMVWTTMATPLILKGSSYSLALLIARIVLTALACFVMLLAFRTMANNMKLRNKENVEEEWYWLMHLTALSQLSFGLFHSIFLMTLVVDFLDHFR